MGSGNRRRQIAGREQGKIEFSCQQSHRSGAVTKNATEPVEVFGPESEINRHFSTGPVAGFLVDDIQAATAELRAAGVEILFESGVDDSGNAWVHFRAPDGNIYELTQDPGVSRRH